MAVAAGSIGAMISAAAIWIGSFWLFMAGSLLTGVYMSAQGFYRFAATDTAPQDFCAKGDQLGHGRRAVCGGDRPGPTVRYTDGMTRRAVSGNLSGDPGAEPDRAVPFAFLTFQSQSPAMPSADTGRGIDSFWRCRASACAMICGTVSYALMNLMMTSTSLAVTGCGFDQKDAANIISLHALSMFAPSFFTRHADHPLRVAAESWPSAWRS